MKYNKHYKPPKAAKKKRPAKKPVAKVNPPKKGGKAKRLSKDEALMALGQPSYLSPQVEDLRKDKSKKGTFVALLDIRIVDDQPILYAIADSSAIKNPKPRRNAKGKAKPAAEKTPEEIAFETTKNIVANLEAGASAREKIMASVKLQSLGGKMVSPIPNNPEAAFSLGLYQGILTVKAMCPTYKIPGISLINKDAANILATIAARKETEKETVLELARRGTFDQDDEGVDGYLFTESYESLEPRSQLRVDLGALMDRVPADPMAANAYGYRLGMQYGLEACPFKWIPFVPAFRKIRDQMQLMERMAAQEEASQYEMMQRAAAAERRFQAQQLSGVAPRALRRPR